MVVRSSATICGGVIMLAVSSAAMARTEIDAVHSYLVDRVASGATNVGAAPMYGKIGGGWVQNSATVTATFAMEQPPTSGGVQQQQWMDG
jgi:hypothetical protein